MRYLSSNKRKTIFLKYIEDLGSPLTDVYETDPLDGELQKATIQIRVSVWHVSLSFLKPASHLCYEKWQ